MARAKKSNTEEESGFSEIINRFKAHPFLFGGTVIVLIIIIIAFVFVPALPTALPERENLVFGYYNGKAIMQNSYFTQVLRETANMVGFDLQSDYNQNYSMAHQVWFQAFIRTTIHMAVLEEMKNAGYKAPAGEIDRLVAANPEFMEDGRFSVVKYNSYDKNRLLALWRSTEENYITGKFFDDLMGLKVSSAEKDFIGNMAYPERSFEIVSFPRIAYPDSELSAFAAGNMELFKTIHLSRITLSGEKEARQLIESIQSGKTTFEDAARNHSTDANKDKGGDMGLRMAYEIFTDLSEEPDR
ncbi:MAG: SurA N-terminal domain-containing protein, partial [Treponema sp.]|nr:SurA N-terminal domain-containing protein [Treponema sp.]